MKLKVKGLKSDRDRVFRKTLVLPILGNKGQNGPKIGFLHFSKKMSHEMLVRSVLNQTYYDSLSFYENCMSGKNMVFELLTEILLAD